MPSLLRSAAYRVTIIYSVAFALAVALLGAGIYYAFHNALLEQLDSRIDNEMIELTSEYQQGGLQALEAAITLREQDGLTGELGYALFDGAARRIAGKLDTPLPAPGARDIVFIDPREGPDPARAQVRSLGDGLNLVVAADREPIEAVNSTVFSFLLLALVAVLLIGLAGALILGAYLRKRLGGITTAAQAIMAGDLSQRMSISPRDDEFDHLSATLNAMLDRIGVLMENLRQVSGDIAHDLRTPLSRLHTRLEQALTSGQDSAGMQAAIADALAKTVEILTLFAAILRISEVESRKRGQAMQDCELSALLEDICQSFAPALEDGCRVLQWRIAPGLVITGDRELLAQAVINLLENAQKHTPRGTLVSVKLACINGRVQLSVADNGPGVSARDRERISGRFIRLEQARATPGNGLGLNLVAAIADLHGAELAFRDNEPGLQILLRFPESAS
ncbi:MAG: HAMP domain-containing sensor histidine kinase [Pseudomonadales bacterium]|nr:HAMP domain-containing sensor histidine kinase [Pseudomonadales bacterium]